jgi:hypothetical protein
VPNTDLKTMMQMNERLEAVNDEATFLAFVDALIADRQTNGESWENNSIEGFLESASSWATDSNFGARQGLSQASLWKKFAVFLYCGKIYE